MLKALKFVQGSVAKKDFLPALSHFVIENGTVRGFNGTLALCSPIALSISCKPKADSLVAAISKCEEAVRLTLTPTGKLSIKSGSFKSVVNCVEGDTLHAEPEGDRIELNGQALLDGLVAIAPFIGTDATRAWSNGVLLRDQSMFATNNVSLVQYWIGTAFPHVLNLPRAAVKEMIRIGEAPTHAQMVKDSNITFHYSDGRWLRTQLGITEWPNLAKILDAHSIQASVPEQLFSALAAVKPFVDPAGRVFFTNGEVATTRDEDATTYAVPGLPDQGIYNVDILALLKGVATSIDFTTYPKPCIFQGKNLRGALIGMRLT